MTDKKTHIAYFIENGKEIYTAYNKEEIANKILEIIKK